MPVGLVAGQPALNVVPVELLAPDHPGKRHPHRDQLVAGAVLRCQVAVELVGLGLPGGEQFVENAAQRVGVATVLR